MGKSNPPEDMLAWKWKKVQKYYESVYRIKFKKMPEQQVLDELYSKIHQLNDDMDLYLKKRPDLVDKLK